MKHPKGGVLSAALVLWQRSDSSADWLKKKLAGKGRHPEMDYLD
jgi:hypothetical protein